ncbi:MAG: hypothetical protein B7Y05_08260 [Polynucleobacter sp. 24-46-87]|jgi:hypothetical protein|nr:MAG: hypothetical protein B7Y67_12365 [Polynucleobacter sp. 35-46-11]OZA14053.1 MAG: hypothetical protein B7Y05_08260 [Polynucleobacter sp. 24-46-87]OZA77555.1 MAG: hypothetical protein B7X71_04575 [Polynucleobacter sp. 39-46-10]
MQGIVHKVQSPHRIGLGWRNERNSRHLGDALLSSSGQVQAHLLVNSPYPLVIPLVANDPKQTFQSIGYQISACRKRISIGCFIEWIVLNANDLQRLIHLKIHMVTAS